MTTARVFKSGNSQAVRLPKQFRVKSKEVEIYRRGDEIVLKEKPPAAERGLSAAGISMQMGARDDCLSRAMLIGGV